MEKGLLDYVLGVGAVLQDTERQDVDLVAVQLIELTVSVLIPLAQPVY